MNIFEEIISCLYSFATTQQKNSFSRKWVWTF